MLIPLPPGGLAPADPAAARLPFPPGQARHPSAPASGGSPKTVAKVKNPSARIGGFVTMTLMRTPAILRNCFLTLLLALTASGAVNAKLASGPQNLGPDLHQAETVLNWLTPRGKTESSTTAALESPVVARGVAKEGDKVFHVFGDGAGPNGRFFTRTDPRTVKNFRDAAGLPPEDTGRFVLEGRLRNVEGVSVTPGGAARLGWNQGGIDEVIVPDSRRQVIIERVSGVNPEF